MYKMAKSNMDAKQAVAKTYYDKKRIEGVKIKIDDHVLVYEPRLKNVKLEPKWVGPCKVLQTRPQIEFMTRNDYPAQNRPDDHPSPNRPAEPSLLDNRQDRKNYDLRPRK